MGPALASGVPAATSPQHGDGQDAVDLDAAPGTGHDGGAGSDGRAPRDRPADAGPRGRTRTWTERLTRWPETAPRWVRGPGAAAALALAVGALAAQQGAARLEDEVAERTAQLSLAVGEVRLEAVPVRESGTRQRASVPATLVVQVLNRGERALEVTATDLSVPSAVLADADAVVALGPDAAAAVAVGPGGAEALRLPLSVDCSAVPPLVPRSLDPASLRPLVAGPPLPGGGPSWVDVRATGAGPPAPVTRLPFSSPPWGAVVEVLAISCGPATSQPVRAVPVEVTEDGRLLVLVSNDSRQVMAVVGRDAPGAVLVADPPLPARIAAGASAQLVLDVDVDCARAGVLDLASGAGVDLVVSTDAADASGPRSTGSAYPALGDARVMAAWAASRVGATCTPR